MATSSVALDTTQYVRVNIGYTTMILQAHNDSVRVVLSTVQPAKSNIAFHTLGGGDAPLPVDVIDVNVWVLAMTDKSSLIVTESAYAIPNTITDKNKAFLELDPLVNSIPTTDTFHHLGHEGKVFIHSDRHPDIANGGNLDILICIPAGESDRQVHMRYNYDGKSNAGGTGLDIDVELYKDTIVSDVGNVEEIVSTNDAIVRTTGVIMYSDPVITDIGTRKTAGMIVGEKRSASSKEQSVPEWIMAPDGNDLRYYTMRAPNNSGTTVDIVNALFFYDSHAELT